MRARSAKRSLLTVGVSALVVLLVAAVTWYLGPWSREWRLGRADLLSLDEMTRADPRDGLAWYYLGRRFDERGSPNRAVAALAQAIELRPADARVKVALGRALLDDGRIEQAFQVLKSAEGSGTAGIEARRALARLYESRGTWHRALEQWRAVAHAQPRSVDAWCGVGRAAVELQKVQEATDATERALRLDPASADALRLHAAIAAAKGDLDGARDTFTRSIRLHPQDPAGYNDLANFVLSQSRRPEDLALADHAIAELARRQPDHPLLSWHRARLAELRDDWPTALRELLATVAAQPNLDEARFQLGNAFYRTGDRARGDEVMADFNRRTELKRRIAHFREMITVSAGDASLYFLLARAQREAGLLPEARKSLDEGFKRAPGSPDGRLEQQRLEAAEREARAAP